MTMYVDNNNNLNNANPSNLYNKDGTLFFSAKNATHGIEPHYFKPCEFATQTRSTYTLMPSQTLHTTQTITANYKFYPNRTVNYFAGNSITLTPGFRVSAGAGEGNTFRAEIRGCN
jgi:hypothetical protein